MGHSIWALEAKAWAHEPGSHAGGNGFDRPWVGAPGGLEGVPRVLAEKCSPVGGSATRRMSKLCSPRQAGFSGHTASCSEGLHSWLNALLLLSWEFLIISSLNVCSVSEVQQDNEQEWERRGHSEHVSLFHAAISHPVLGTPPGTEPWWTLDEHSSARWGKYKVSTPCQGTPESLERPCFLFKPGPASNAKRPWLSKKHQGLRT